MKKKSSVHKRKRLYKKRLALFSSWSKKNWYRIITAVVISLFFLLLPGEGYYDNLRLEYKPPLVRASEFDNFTPAPYPERVYLDSLPQTTAEAIMIRDVDSFVPMFELNPNARLKPASITKLMTALVALDYYDPNSTITVKRLAPVEAEADMGLKVGDTISVKNLIYGLLIPSGGDAAYTLADNYPGGIENFVEAMNKKAESLHLTNTHFQNPAGFDHPNQYTTANDLSLLAAEAIKNEMISKAVSTSGITLFDVTGKKTYPLTNVNQLLGKVDGVDGIKTGFTDEAGQCLITSVSRDGHRVIIVLLKSNDRFTESARLAEWVFRNFNWVNLGPTGNGV